MKWRFRGFDAVGDKGWVYGDLVHNKRMDLTDRVMVGGYEVVPESVGPFTGLVDKKGNKIFEGDILYSEFLDKSGGYSLVGWNDETSSFGIMDEYSYRSIAEGYDFAEFKNYVLLAHLKEAIICEVVGNLHDNPGLLNNE